MRAPRDVDASEMIKISQQYGYIIIRQTGSHIRLSKTFDDGGHHITIPNHKPIKIGTLQSIVKDVRFVNSIDIDVFYNQL